MKKWLGAVVVCLLFAFIAIPLNALHKVQCDEEYCVHDYSCIGHKTHSEGCRILCITFKDPVTKEVGSIEALDCIQRSDIGRMLDAFSNLMEWMLSFFIR